MIIIPMAGKSQRFTRAGYDLPKYRLPLWNETLFHYVLKSFEAYFDTDAFRFVCRRDHDAIGFIRNTTLHLGLADVSIVEIDGDTRGQAETVLLGLDGRGLDEELYIFNIDTIRPNFRKPRLGVDVAGHLEVFEGDGDHWSFVLPGEEGRTLATAEKKRISGFCSDGLYYFSSVEKYITAFESNIQKDCINSELYIAPIYNNLIVSGDIVTYNIVDISDIVFCGTPNEFEMAAALDPDRLFNRARSGGRESARDTSANGLNR